MRAILATLLCGVLIASAQPPQTQQQNAPAPAAKGVAKFEASSQLVVVDVTAKDKSGAPIKGLKASDFTITEDGKKQDIKVFEYQELEETAMPEPKLQSRPPAAPHVPAAAEPAAPPAPVVKSLTANQIAPSKPGEVKY